MFACREPAARPLRRVSSSEFNSKATDKEKSKGLTVRVKRKTVNYWMLLPFPVLLVRYLAETGDVYAVWVHDHVRELALKDTKTVGFTFTDNDILTVERAPVLAEDARQFYEIRRGDLSWPLRVGVRTDVDDAAGLRRLVKELNDVQEDIPNRLIFRLAPGATECPMLTLEPPSVHFELGAGIGASTTLETDIGEALRDRRFAADILALASLALGTAGQDAAVVDLVERFVERMTLFGGSAGISLGFSLLRRGRRDLVLRLIERAGPLRPRCSPSSH